MADAYGNELRSIPWQKPIIKSAVFSVNPVNINAKTILTVYIEEETVYLKPEYMRAGELFAGEV